VTAVGGASASAEVISLAEERASVRTRLLLKWAREVGERAFARAGLYDEDGGYPTKEMSPRCTRVASARPSCPRRMAGLGFPV
jgi:hypothetical protein